jgi:predicted RNA-binding protein YlqC (UPF0109 family)
MADQTQDILSLVEMIVSTLVDEPELVELTTSTTESTMLIEISVASADISKIIGRNGRVIKAIRTLARAVATISGPDQVDVEIIS